MDQTTTGHKEAKESKGKKYTHSVIRVTREIGKRFFSVMDQVNSKDGGGRVSASALLERLLPRVTPEDIRELQEGSLSNADRFNRNYALYLSESGKKISRDEFLGLVMSGAIQTATTA